MGYCKDTFKVRLSSTGELVLRWRWTLIDHLGGAIESGKCRFKDEAAAAGRAAAVRNAPRYLKVNDLLKSLSKKKIKTAVDQCPEPA